MAQSTSLANQQLVLTVRRREAELVPPAKPTPCVHLPLSDNDDQPALHLLIPGINFYGHGSDISNATGITMSCRDPVKVIREALAEALVFYYPLAGRLREGPGRKLFVDCTGALGVLFVEADADATLEQFGVPLQPPFPFLEELLHDVPGSDNVVGCPLLLVQVTRLTCGGFIVAYRYNHVMVDGLGILRFLTAVGELARGRAPSLQPVWERELLKARVPPRMTCSHQVIGAPLEDIVDRSFFLGPAEVMTLRQMVPPGQRRNCTSFDLITACVWRCRTISLGFKPHEDVRVLLTVNARDKYKPRIPNGYYGNAVAFPAALTTASELCSQPLSYALEVVMKAKENVTEENTSDLMILSGRTHDHLSGNRTFFFSNMRQLGFRHVDFGWGKAGFGGMAKCSLRAIPGLINFCIPGKDGKDQDGTLVLLSLPASAMEVFEEELKGMLNHAHQSTPPIPSPL